MRRTWSLITSLLTLAALLILASCGSTPAASNNNSSSGSGGLDPNKKYTVVFDEAFGTGANKTTLATLTQQYMKAHPNVTVQLQPYADYATLKTKITAAIAAGKPPAIAQIYEEWATEYQKAGALLSLQPFIAGKDGLSQSDLADFYPVMLKDGQINGTQYMLPFNKSVVVLYYNQDMLQKAGLSVPATMADFTSDLTKLTKPDGSQWGLSYTPDVDYWSVLYKGLGGTGFVSSDGKKRRLRQWSQRAVRAAGAG